MSFKSTSVLQGIKSAIDNAPSAERQATIKKANAIFQFDIKNAQDEECTWVLDFKSAGTVNQGKPPAGTKADIVISVGDDTFVDLASGKTTGQKAFMSGKLKVKGNMMLATRLDGILKVAPKSSGSSSPTAPTNAGDSKSSNGGSLKIDGVQSSSVFAQIHASITSMPATERSAIVGKAKAIYQFNIKATGDKIHSFTLDLKNGNGDVYLGACKNGKPEIAITISDKDFVDLAGGKLNGQKAFMSGKLKIQGNMMLATKLDSLLKQIQRKPKL